MWKSFLPSFVCWWHSSLCTQLCTGRWWRSSGGVDTGPPGDVHAIHHLNCLDSGRCRTVEYLIMRSNGMSWRQLFSFLQYCLIILAQPRCKPHLSLISSNHALSNEIRTMTVNEQLQDVLYCYKQSSCLWFISTTKAHIFVFVTSHLQTIWPIHIQSKYLWFEFL